MAEQKPMKRILLSCDATYRVSGDIAPPVSVVVNELSMNGVTFVTTNRLPSGESLDLRVFFTEKSDPIEARGLVVQQNPISSKFLFTTTVEFVVLSPRDKGRLDSFLTHETENIKMGRAHVRCAMTSPVRCRRAEEPTKILTCFSGDISVKGIKLFMRQRIASDTEVILEFELPGHRAEMRLRGNVVWAKETTGQVWATGIEFLDVSSFDQDHIMRFINHTLSKG